jgi:hypothetical protein
MADGPGCDEVRALTAELSLGVAAGEDRARAVHHLEHCARCREEVGDLAEVLDELLLLAPEREPPPGFESLVLTKMNPRRLGRRWQRILALSAAACVAAAIGAGAVWMGTGEDRRTAESFRAALERAGGQYFGVEFLHTGSGGRVGHAFVYGGAPSWVFVVVKDPSESGSFNVEVITHQNEVVPAGTLELSAGDQGAGLTLPIELRDVSRIQLVPRGGGETLEAELPPPPSPSD